MKKFTWGKKIETFIYNFDGKEVEIIKYHPWKTQDNHVLTHQPDLSIIAFSCPQIHLSAPSIEYILIAWIAKQNLGLNQYPLVEGIAKALEII